MTNYFWHRILIHGNAPSNSELVVFCILILSLLVLTVWLDPV